MTSRIEEDFELELRSLPGVLNVSVSRHEDGSVDVVTLLVYGLNVKETEGVASQIASLYFPEARIVVEDANNVLTPSAAENSRVILTRAASDGDSGACEVELNFQGRSATGHSRSGPLIGGAESTLMALRDLGCDIPFSLASVTSLPASKSWPVIVTMRANADGSERYGIAQADDDVVAAAKATLDALNRFPMNQRTR